ncbi:MAG: hypothetical protein NVSMB29_09290 [Candidatus Dormibacteria bacterium]
MPGRGLGRHTAALGVAALVALGMVGVRSPAGVRAQSTGYVAAPTLVQYGLRCEAAALSIALAAKGINVSQDWVQNHEGTDARAAIMDGAGYPIRWGDPYRGFVGDVNARMAVGGYGVYAPPMVSVARQAGAVAWGGENWNPRDLYAQVALGNPAVVWVPWSLEPPVMRTMQTWEGRTVWFSRQEHAQTLVGFDQNAGTVELDDPESGNLRTFSMALFETRFAQMHGTAVVVSRQAFSAPAQLTASQGVIAVRGGDDKVWATTPGGDFSDRGGQVIGAPAVARNLDGKPFYIVTGTDNALWIRDDLAGWRRLSTDPYTACLDAPATTVRGTVLTVACEGTDHAAYATQVSLVAGQLPQVGSLTWLGGVLASGPAVGVVGDHVTFLANGADGRVWTRTDTGAAWTPTNWACLGHPALVTNPVGGTVAFACHGGDDAVWFASAPGVLPAATVQLGGRANDGVALAPLPDGGFQVTVMGDNCELWVNQVSATGAAAGWRPMGGIAISGAGGA